jgi:hypothetical protein
MAIPNHRWVCVFVHVRVRMYMCASVCVCVCMCVHVCCTSLIRFLIIDVTCKMYGNLDALLNMIVVMYNRYGSKDTYKYIYTHTRTVCISTSPTQRRARRSPHKAHAANHTPLSVLAPGSAV